MPDENIRAKVWLKPKMKEDRNRNIKLHKHQKANPHFRIRFTFSEIMHFVQSNRIPNYLNSIEINFSIPLFPYALRASFTLHCSAYADHEKIQLFKY